MYKRSVSFLAKAEERETKLKTERSLRDDRHGFSKTKRVYRLRPRDCAADFELARLNSNSNIYLQVAKF